MRSRLNLSGWLIDPTKPIITLTAIQLLLWGFFMSEYPVIPGVAPRHSSEIAGFKMLLILLAYVVGVSFGKRVGVPRRKEHRSLVERAGRIRFYGVIASLAFILSVIGEIVLLRELLSSPVWFTLLGRTNIEELAYIAGQSKIMGITSLVNLSIIPVAYWAWCLFSGSIEAAKRKRYAIYLAVAFVWWLFRAIYLSQRVFVVYYVTVVFGVAVLRGIPIRLRTAFVGLSFIVVILLVGQLLRAGVNYSIAHEVPLWSAEVIRFCLEMVATAYFASDINNALILLDYEPSMQLISTGVSTANLLRTLIGIKFVSYSAYVPNFTSSYGTVHFIGLWWFDFGWLAVAVAFLIGSGLGWLYRRVSLSKGHELFYVLLYSLCIPGVYAMCRVNFFFLSIFLLPMSFLTLSGMPYELLAAKENKRRCSAYSSMPASSRNR